jgi:hypothetical protein
MSQQMQPQKIRVKEAQQKAWRSVFQDGLWDIYLGLLLLTMGIGDLLDNMDLTKTRYYTIFFGIYAVSLLLLWAGKRFITLPRLGRVKFGPAGKTRRNKVRLLLFAVPVPLQILSRGFMRLNTAFYTFAIPAGNILVMGTVYLFRFLRKYPFHPEPTIIEMN